MTIFAAVGEREACWIGEATRRAMDDFGDQRERLKGARTELLQKQQFSEIAQIAFISNREHGAKTFQVDISRADIMISGHTQVTRRIQSRLRFFASNVEKRSLRGLCLSIDEIHDHALILPDYSSVRFSDEIAHPCRVPVVAASHAAPIVQALLHNGPFAFRRHAEVMQIDLKTVSNCVIL